jgi:hypothetical protein
MFLLKKIKPNVIVTWGILSLSLLLAIYLGTGDVDGLVNQNGFSRTALIPTLLLTLGILQQPHHIFGNMKQE